MSVPLKLPRSKDTSPPCMHSHTTVHRRDTQCTPRLVLAVAIPWVRLARFHLILLQVEVIHIPIKWRYQELYQEINFKALSWSAMMTSLAPRSPLRGVIGMSLASWEFSWKNLIFCLTLATFMNTVFLLWDYWEHPPSLSSSLFVFDGVFGFRD